MSARVSPDGMYYWDGARWVTTLSPDGRYRWDGTAWKQVAAAPYISSQYWQPPAMRREPTSWTRPLQYAVIGWYAISALYAISAPFWMKGYFDLLANQFAAAYPPGEADTMRASYMFGVYLGAFLEAAVAVVAIIGAIKTWRWVHWAVMILLGLTLLLLPLDLLAAASSSSSPAYNAIPAWVHWESIGARVAAGVLAVWMVITLIAYGPWAMRKVS